MRVGVIGRGTVGRAVEALFEGSAEVIAWDTNDGAESYPASDLEGCDCVFVCVPTPDDGTGGVDLDHVRSALAALPAHRVILKSTVPPGSTDSLAAEFGKEICFWPEYIGESSYYNPYFSEAIQEMPFVVLGGIASSRKWAIQILLRVLGPTKTYFQCPSVEAELIKYAENSFFATKITFANEFKNICEAHGADWTTVREGWILDPRISPMHTAVFEHDPGFGGKCLPKDTKAIVDSASRQGYDAALLRQVLSSNDGFRAADPDEMHFPK